jgi:hypothetical protein
MRHRPPGWPYNRFCWGGLVDLYPPQSSGISWADGIAGDGARCHSSKITRNSHGLDALRRRGVKGAWPPLACIRPAKR